MYPCPTDLLPLLRRFYYDVLLVDQAADVRVCLFRNDKPFLKHARRVTSYFFALFGLIVPLIIIVILYGLIINVLRKNSKGQQVAKGKKRVTKMVSAVISSFIICWTPMQMYLIYIHHDQVPILFAILAQCLVYISACVNPILYAFLSEPFRKAFQQFLTCSKLLSNHLTNQNGNETILAGKHTTYNAIQRQQLAKKGVTSKINPNDNQRTRTVTNSTSVAMEVIEKDQLLRANLTSSK